MAIYRKTIFTIFIFLLSFALADGKVASINRAMIDDLQTITVFFNSPQTFKPKEIQDQFVIKRRHYGDRDDEIVTDGRWRLSADGYQLSYSPINEGSYEISPKHFSSYEKSDLKNRYIYIGRSSQMVKIIGRGPVQPLKHYNLPVESIGTQEIDIEFFDIQNPAQLFERFYIGSDIDRWELDEISRGLKPAGIFRYVLPKGTPLDRKSKHRIPVDHNIKPGAYIVTVSPAGQIYKELDTRILFISDIGLHARRYAEKTLIIANYFSTSFPVKNARLEIWKQHNNELQVTEEDCTFNEGMCLINRSLSNDEIVVVRQDGDISMLPMREIALDLNDFPILGDVYNKQVAHIYSNRQLFRPSEEITLNTLLRDADGSRLPNQNIELRIINPDGKTDQTHSLTEDASGFYQANIKIANEAKTGLWRAEVRTDPNLKKPTGELKLHIEEFMPERMELILKKDDKQLAYNDALSLDIDSRYLFGAPANRNLVKSQISLKVNSTPFIKHKDWYVGSPQQNYSLLSYYPFDEEFRLDDEGHATRNISLPFNSQIEKTPHVISTFVNVAVLDGDMAGITRKIKADFWPQDVVPVIRPLFQMSDLGWGSRADFEIFAANQNGEKIARDLRLTLRYKSDWCTWVYSRSGGWDCHRNNDYEIHEMKSFKGNNSVNQYGLDPNLWGEYQLVVTDVNSGFETIYNFEASWDSSNDGQLPASKPLALNLKPNKLNFKDGDTVELEVNAPFEGFLTLLIEGDEPLFNESYEVRKGSNQISIPLYTNWKRHDLYLTGLLLAKNSKEDVRRALGILPISFDRSDRRIFTTLEYDEITKPEEPFKVNLKVVNPNPNEKLYATISVTDQGILNMTPTEPVNIFDAFFKQRRYNVDIVDYYSRLFKDSNLNLLTPKFGGDGEVEQSDSGAPNLTEMKTVSLTSELLPINAQGEVSTEFMLPDFNGEAKIVAKVFSDQRLSETDEQVVIRAPIIADLVTPNFIRVADETHVSLSLHNMSGREDDISIALSSNEIDINYNETIHLADKASQNVLIPMSLKKYSDEAYLNLTVKSSTFDTERSYRMGTVPFLPDKTIEIDRKVVKSEGKWNKDQSQFTDSFANHFDEMLLISRLPIIDINNYTDNLFSYPYGCTEQTTSRAFPWLFKSNPILDLEKMSVYNEYHHNRKNYSPLDVSEEKFQTWQKSLMRDAVTRIIRRQRSDGGFNLWSSDYTTPAITAYASDFLYQASKQYPDLVSTVALDHAASALKSILNEKNRVLKLNHNNRYNNINDVAYGAWVLAREGKIFNADLIELTKNSSKMSPLSRAYIAAASFVVGNSEAGIRLMNDVNFEQWNSHYGYFYTDIAEIALTIDLINQLKTRNLYRDPESKTADLIILLDERLASKKYFSTQERYALIRIGVDLPQDNTNLNLRINGRTETIKPNQLLDASSIDSIEPLDAESLYIQYQAEGYPSKKESKKSFNVDINRSIVGLYSIDDISEVNVGDRFLVTLTIKPARSVPNALVIDQIPGGFRLVNPNLLDEEIDDYYGSFTRNLKRSDNLHHEEFRFNSYVASLNMQGNGTYHFAYVIEAQTPGTYEIPSTFVEAMYIPILRATQAHQGKIVIKKAGEAVQEFLGLLIDHTQNRNIINLQQNEYSIVMTEAVNAPFVNFLEKRMKERSLFK